jgi:hypothetical protein
MNDELGPLRAAVAAACELDLGVVPCARVPLLAAELTRLAHGMLATAAQWLDEVQRTGGFSGSSYSGATTFLGEHCGISRRTAHELVSLGSALNQAPELAEAARRGTLSPESAAVVGTVANHPAFAAHGADLVREAEGLAPVQARAAVDRWRYAHTQLQDAAADDAQRDARRGLAFTQRKDGSVQIEGVLPPMPAQIVRKRLRVIVERDLGDGSGRTYAQRLADALVELASGGSNTSGVEAPDPASHVPTHGSANSLGTSGMPGASGRSAPPWNARSGSALLVSITYDDLFERAGRPGWASDASAVSPTDMERLLCEANLHLVVRSSRGQPLFLGSAQRFAPYEHWLALAARDGGCRWEHCHAPPEECIVHHEPPMPFGATDITKEVLLCSGVHHWQRHRHGTTAHLDPVTAAYTVTTAEGHTFTTQPRHVESGGRAAAPPRRADAHAA